MFEIWKNDDSSRINFISKFGFTSILSIILVVGSLFLIITKMKYGVDFAGGAEVQLKFAKEVKLEELRKTLKKAGYKGVAVQSIGDLSENESLVKVAAQNVDLNVLTQNVSETLNKNFADYGVEVRKVDIVGPKAGAELRWRGFQAMMWALVAIMIYIGLRFDFKYSPGAIVALLHDVTIVLGVFTVFGYEFTLQTVAALLAVIGYSVNDTVVVYDRVREHEEKYAGVELSEHINLAINETLSRTFLTSITTLFVALTMWFFGGLAIRNFFTAITAGVLIGTYSSIFVAAPVTLFMDRIRGGAGAGSSSKVKA